MESTEGHSQAKGGCSWWIDLISTTSSSIDTPWEEAGKGPSSSFLDYTSCSPESCLSAR